MVEYGCPQEEAMRCVSPRVRGGGGARAHRPAAAARARDVEVEQTDAHLLIELQVRSHLPTFML